MANTKTSVDRGLRPYKAAGPVGAIKKRRPYRGLRGAIGGVGWLSNVDPVGRGVSDGLTLLIVKRNAFISFCFAKLTHLLKEITALVSAYFHVLWCDDGVEHVVIDLCGLNIGRDLRGL